MTHERTEVGPWCTICGAPGTIEFLGLDTSRPIGRCQRGAPYGRGCGRVILTRVRADAEFVTDQRGRRVARQHHWQHRDQHGQPSLEPLCSECDAIRATHDARR